VPRLRALARHWTRQPPVPRLLAAALGLTRSDGEGRQDFASFVRAMTGAAPPE
jgi:hypothetical protein